MQAWSRPPACAVPACEQRLGCSELLVEVHHAVGAGVAVPLGVAAGVGRVAGADDEELSNADAFDGLAVAIARGGVVAAHDHGAAAEEGEAAGDAELEPF